LFKKYDVILKMPPISATERRFEFDNFNMSIDPLYTGKSSLDFKQGGYTPKKKKTAPKKKPVKKTVPKKKKPVVKKR
jgi:hypothetical protein